MSFQRSLTLLFVISMVVMEFQYAYSDSIHNIYKTNRTKRQTKSRSKSNSAEAILPWRRVYAFSMQLSKAFGNNALLSNLNDMITTDMGKVSKAYCGGGYGYGGRGGYGYGGYSYGQPPVVYYMQPAQQVIYMNDGVTDFTSGFGESLSNNELLERLIGLIENLVSSSYTYYYEETPAEEPAEEPVDEPVEEPAAEGQ